MMTITSGTNVTTLKFYYDAEGIPFYLDYNGTGYYYVTNLQGDVVGIANSNGVVGYYEYDAWGRIVAMDAASSMEYSALTTNPLRYRGYIYDTETGFYYLQTRYYDPAIRRFINADSYASTGTGFLGYNMFAYCENNPVNRVDSTGQSWSEFWNTFTQSIQQASGYFVTATGISQVDSPMLGPADVVGGVLILGGILWCATTAMVDTIGNFEHVSIIEIVEFSTPDDPDPYGRAGQKKQGRERKNKARQKKDWKPRSRPKPLPKHTPGRDHRKYSNKIPFVKYYEGKEDFWDEIICEMRLSLN